MKTHLSKSPGGLLKSGIHKKSFCFVLLKSVSATKTGSVLKFKPNEENQLEKMCFLDN